MRALEQMPRGIVNLGVLPYFVYRGGHQRKRLVLTAFAVSQQADGIFIEGVNGKVKTADALYRNNLSRLSNN